MRPSPPQQPLTAPTLVITLGTKGTQSQAVGAGPNGSTLAARLPNARSAEIAPAFHYTFLAECTFFAPILLYISDKDPICSDPSGAVHARIIAETTACL